MSRLIINELTKIFHKKVLYVVAVLTIAFMILSVILNNFLNNLDFDIGTNAEKDFYKEQIESLEAVKDVQSDEYYNAKASLEAVELKENYQGKENEWKRNIIMNKGIEIITNKIKSEGTENVEKYKAEYNQFIEKLNNNDWKFFIQKDLAEVEQNIKILSEDKTVDHTKEIEMEKINKQELEWRLQKNINYDNSNMDMLLNQWSISKKQILEKEQNENTKSESYNDKYSKQAEIETLKLTEYAIEHDLKDSNLSISTDRVELSTTVNDSLTNSFTGWSTFILIAIIIVAGSIVSEEFSKGTIKFLLVRPYKRYKILMAKFVACLIVFILACVFVVIAQFIIGGISNGFGGYGVQTVIYNFNTNSVEQIGTIKHLLLSFLAKMPQFLLLMTLAFSLSTIFTNTAIAIALPLFGMSGAEIINLLLYTYEKARFLIFFVTPNWNLNQYMFGRLPQVEQLSLPFSITICLVYFIIMLVVDIIVFNKKEIKNI